MAYVSGPCSSLPGATFRVPEYQMCDDHPSRPAVKRVQGETDSFGAEYHDLCQECFDEHLKQVEAARIEAATGMCEWCKQPATDLRKRRDFEEGSCGRVYDVCGACVKKENEECTAELGERDYYDEMDFMSEIDDHDD